MITDLEPYPAYQSSGVEWLEELPQGWAVLPLKRVARINPRKSEVPPESRTHAKITFLPMESVYANGTFDSDSLVPIASVWDNGYSYFRRDDVILAKITPCFENGKRASLTQLPTDIGFGSTEFIVLRPSTRVLSRYLGALVGLPTFRQLGTDSMQGAGGQKRVPKEFVAGFDFPFPPIEDQSKIIRFLDYIDLQIQRFIEGKERLIELLEEQRRAAISRAVIYGLDSKLPKKPSGFDWLGEIPAHWDISRSKWCFREIDQRSETGAEELLSVSHLTGVTPRADKNVTMFEAESYEGHKVCEAGDLVVNTMWAWMGALGISPMTGLVSPSYGVYRPNRASLDPAYCEYLLGTATYIAEIRRRSTGIRSSRLRLYADEFLRIPIVCPPLDEQREIAHAMNSMVTTVEAAKSAALGQIDRLREFQNRLISEILIGRLDVRDAECRLPSDLDTKSPAEELGAR